MKRTALICLFLGAAGCGAPSSPEPAQDELEALLRDEPLATRTTRSALTTDGGVSAPDSGLPPAPDAGIGPAPDAGIGPAPDAAIGPSRDASVVPDSGLGFDATPPPPDGDGGVSGIDGGSFVPDAGLGGGATIGRWSFDDCNDRRTELFDDTFNGNTAFRTVSARCTPGTSGQAVALVDPSEDLVMVPDQPSFTFGEGVTAAGWFRADSVRQTASLVRKRDDNTSAFVLLINQGRYQFVVNLGRGRAASVQSRARAVVGRWTHVAGTYDGEWLRLYVDGAESASARVLGAIRDSSGPFLMGNDGTHRLLQGAIDNAEIDGRALARDEITRLLCRRRPARITASPAVSAPTPPDVPALFDVTVHNDDTPECDPQEMVISPNFFVPGIDVQPGFQFIPQVPAGGQVTVPVTVTASSDVDPGTYTIPFVLSTRSSTGAEARVDFVLAATGCRVSTGRELMITNLSVVDDPVRTAPGGVWSFAHLMEAMAPTPADAPAMVEAMLSTFDAPQVINGFTVQPRPGMRAFILDQWPRIDGQLDLSRAPLTLQAIVNRFDLRDPAAGDAGEGRFVFAFNSPGSPFPLQATLILEYKLPASTPADVDGWAQQWHALGALPVPSEPYNAALAAITERFAGRNARPGAVNGSAISTVRTNEIDLGDNGRWELREFRLSAATGTLVPSTLDRTPDLSFNGSNVLSDFVVANEPAILTETHQVPASFAGAPFAGGAVFNDLNPWFVPGAGDDARFRFSTNTCNGCHSLETNTVFLQVSPRFPGGEAQLSQFLTGTTVFDPFTGTPRQLGELRRRSVGLRGVVCP